MKLNTGNARYQINNADSQSQKNSVEDGITRLRKLEEEEI